VTSIQSQLSTNLQASGSAYLYSQIPAGVTTQYAQGQQYLDQGKQLYATLSTSSGRTQLATELTTRAGQQIGGTGGALLVSFAQHGFSLSPSAVNDYATMAGTVAGAAACSATGAGVVLSGLCGSIGGMISSVVAGTVSNALGIGRPSQKTYKEWSEERNAARNEARAALAGSIAQLQTAWAKMAPDLPPVSTANVQQMLINADAVAGPSDSPLIAHDYDLNAQPGPMKWADLWARCHNGQCGAKIPTVPWYDALYFNPAIPVGFTFAGASERPYAFMVHGDVAKARMNQVRQAWSSWHARLAEAQRRCYAVMINLLEAVRLQQRLAEASLINEQARALNLSAQQTQALTQAYLIQDQAALQQAADLRAQEIATRSALADSLTGGLRRAVLLERWVLLGSVLALSTAALAAWRLR